VSENSKRGRYDGDDGGENKDLEEKTTGNCDSSVSKEECNDSSRTSTEQSALTQTSASSQTVTQKVKTNAEKKRAPKFDKQTVCIYDSCYK
jgi:hypothetical protein